MFRAAREQLQAGVGSHTLAGDLRMLAGDERLDSPTLEAPPNAAALGQFTCYLKDSGNVYPLHLGVNSVGRLPDNDVVLRDEHVSRRHCAVVVHTDFRCDLHDVASKNGTILNGKKIAGPTKLRPGDQITLCTRKLTFVAEYGTPQSDPKPAG